MPSQRSKIDPFADLAAQVVANDTVLQSRMKRIINALINDAEDLVRFGSPSERQRLFQAVVPQLFKSMIVAEASEADKKGQAAFERLMAGLRGEDGADHPAEG